MAYSLITLFWVIASKRMVQHCNATHTLVLCKLALNTKSVGARHLTEAPFALNTMLNISTRMSPVQLVFGFVPQLLHQKVHSKQQPTMPQRLWEFRTNWNRATSNSENAQDMRKTLYGYVHHQSSLQPGDLTWNRRQEPTRGRHPKLTLIQTTVSACMTENTCHL